MLEGAGNLDGSWRNIIDAVNQVCGLLAAREGDGVAPITPTAKSLGKKRSENRQLTSGGKRRFYSKGKQQIIYFNCDRIVTGRLIKKRAIAGVLDSLRATKSKRRTVMTQKVIEVVGTSKESFAKAAENAVREAAKTVRGMKWARVAELEMELDGKKIVQYRAATKIDFDIEH
jgi:hypothetical protein